MSFQQVPGQIDFVAQEHEVLELWRRTSAFDKLRALRAGSPRWSFIDGPITANNPMGVHHGWGRTYKDLFHRFKAMQGFETRYQNGFDCQGLWVEVNVERDMGFKSKREIESFGLAEFVKLCKQRVLTYAAVQTEQSVRLGYWMDWNDPAVLRMLGEALAKDPGRTVTVQGKRGPVTGTVEQVVGLLGMPELGGSYFTFSDENNYTIWSVLKSCHDRGWVYKGRDVMPWCARCGTGLSQHEIVTEGYRELTHETITLRFPLLDRPGESLLVWTTTPWTLSSNVAAAVGPELDYLRVKQGDEVFYLAAGTVARLKGAHEVLGHLKGRELLGWRYKGPFDELPVQQAARAPEHHRVIAWEEVGEEEGTGIVHIAPGCGAEDFELSTSNGLPVIAPLDELGVFVEGFDWLTGQDVQSVAKPIIAKLREKGILYRTERYAHRYPVCWRCSTELVFRLVDEWYISMGAQLDKPLEEVTEKERRENLRYQMMEVVAGETKWYPSFGYDREMDWLRNMRDWMISKKRYWGLALPIYECSACGHFDVIGSREELRARAVSGWERFEGHSPHRPWIDEVALACSKCGKPVRRIPDVGNPWLDAGIVAMSTLSYRQDRSFWETWFPADLISESFPGQFRNWFYSLLAMSTILERRAPFHNVFSYATLLDEQGKPMHKSAGNAIEFNEAADKMGADVMRWLYCDHKPEKDLLFGYHRADEARRQVLLPLWNVYSFFVTYALIDGWTPSRGAAAARPGLLDRWILARLAECVGDVTRRLEGYEPDLATEAVVRFLDDLTNWYVRRSRRRFWAKRGATPESDADKEAAYRTLYGVLTTLIRLLAPFLPFVTEAIHQNLVRAVDPSAPESVHHCSWPAVEQERGDPMLTREMALVLRLVSLGHSARSLAGRKARQPLAEAAFAVASAAEREVVERYADLIRDELNVKRVRLLDAASEVVDYRLKPLPKQLGQKYGGKSPKIREALLALNAAEAARKLAAGEPVEVHAAGERFDILAEEVELIQEAHAGFSTAAEGAYLAALDTRVTPELEEEGLAREFVRRVQDLRKKADFSVDDRIRIEYAATREMASAVERNRDYVQGETLASGLEQAEAPRGEARERYDLDGEGLEIAVTRTGSKA